MKRTIFIFPALALLGCGDDSTIEHTPPAEVSISVNPTRVLLDVGDRQDFTANVYGSSNRNVTWRAQDIIGGNTDYGTIDTAGEYRAPATEPEVDSIKITAVADADTAVKVNAWAIIIDPSKIYVGENGSDIDGSGSRNSPFRTIAHALSVADINKTVIVMAGEYNTASGEEFPLTVPGGVVLQGRGRDSTFIIGPGGSHDEFGAVVRLNSFPSTVERFNISTEDQNGVGVWVMPGQLVKVKDNQIHRSFAGVITAGPSLPRPIIESNLITDDSVGVMTTESSEPLVRDNVIRYCGQIGLYILDSSRPDIGTVDSTDAGGNTIMDCGPGNQWLVRNESPDTIWAVGNEWQFPNPLDNDQFIYDDDESGGVSGPVLLINQ